MNGSIRVAVISTVAAVLLSFSAGAGTALQSIDTGCTITLVRTGQANGEPFIAASGYQGTVLAIDDDGEIAWKNPLSGFKNHDLWCADITGDQVDEIFAASADGAIYCMNHTGEIRWRFKTNDVPMMSVCVIHNEGQAFVVCGGYDKNLYYLNSDGGLVKRIASSTYSQEPVFAPPHGSKRVPEANQHVINFLRVLPQADGSEVLAVQPLITKSTGNMGIYLFKPLADQPVAVHRTPRQMAKGAGGWGAFNVCDPDGDGQFEVLAGSSGAQKKSRMVRYDPDSGAFGMLDLSKLIGRYKLGSGYRVVQPVFLSNEVDAGYLILFGNHLLLVPQDLDPTSVEAIETHYAYYDICRDPVTGKLILASSQSGGSCVHILDPNESGWKEDYAALNPPGKISEILKNTAEARQQLESFKKPSWENDAQTVYLMTENLPTDSLETLAKNLMRTYENPLFLNGMHFPKVETFDRSSFPSETYREKRDRRRKYVLSQSEVLDEIIPGFDGYPGVAYWGGHGNDPFFFQRETSEKVMDAAKGKMTVLIYPELGDTSSDFDWVMENLFYPLGDHARDRNGRIFFRTKSSCWQSMVYLPTWKKVLDGHYADVFIPALEETGSKPVEISVGGRMGLWASGVADSWGARAVRDNPAYMGVRKHCHQRLPNHFLRNQVYNLACGAQYINNFSVDQDYMSLLWELVAKGALYVPKRSEMVSFNPVHLSMTAPDPDYLDEAANTKWLVFYDEEKEQNRPMVFSRMNGTWPAAKVTDWDFSRYAAGVDDRQHHFLPNYPQGVVLITPPQTGAFAEMNAPRGKLVDHLNPIYQGILKEYYTDGKDYFSEDGKTTYRADTYYRQIEEEIQAGAQQIPLTVSGDVAWVCAQTAPNHLRLTLIENGYLNPHQATATIQFNTVEPSRITDLLSKKRFTVDASGNAQIEVPLGLFRFIDIQLKEALR